MICPAVLSGPYYCTFELGTCGYRNVEESEELDTFDWTLRIAGTPSGRLDLQLIIQLDVLVMP